MTRVELAHRRNLERHPGYRLQRLEPGARRQPQARKVAGAQAGEKRSWVYRDGAFPASCSPDGGSSHSGGARIHGAKALAGASGQPCQRGQDRQPCCQSRVGDWKREHSAPFRRSKKGEPARRGALHGKAHRDEGSGNTFSGCGRRIAGSSGRGLRRRSASGEQGLSRPELGLGAIAGPRTAAPGAAPAPGARPGRHGRTVG